MQIQLPLLRTTCSEYTLYVKFQYVLCCTIVYNELLVVWIFSCLYNVRVSRLILCVCTCFNYSIISTFVFVSIYTKHGTRYRKHEDFVYQLVNSTWKEGHAPQFLKAIVKSLLLTNGASKIFSNLLLVPSLISITSDAMSVNN